MTIAMHMVLPICVGAIVGSTFQDINQYNDSTAGVQDRFVIKIPIDILHVFVNRQPLLAMDPISSGLASCSFA